MMITLEESLGLLDLSDAGKPLPVSYDSLCRRIAMYLPDVKPYEYVARLRGEGLIAIDSSGDYCLTETGLERRKPLSRPAPPPANVHTERPWAKFRALCGYYADCVQQSEKTQGYLFPDGLNVRYLLPSLPPDWLVTREEIPFEVSERQKPAFLQIEARKDIDEDVYIGYPLEAFQGTNCGTVYAPVLLFPASFKLTLNHASLCIRQEEVGFNQDWIEFNVPREDQPALLSAAFACHDKTKPAFGISTVVQYLANKFKIALDPNRLDFDLFARRKGLLNVAVLFVGQKLKYSKTLKAELLAIAREPANVLDGTALAYVFRNPRIRQGTMKS